MFTEGEYLRNLVKKMDHDLNSKWLNQHLKMFNLLDFRSPQQTNKLTLVKCNILKSQPHDLLEKDFASKTRQG